MRLLALRWWWVVFISLSIWSGDCLRRLPNLAAAQPAGDWQTALTTSTATHWAQLAYRYWLFHKLALGLSGFETGVAVMPLIKGSPQDEAGRPFGRIRNTQRLLTFAAVIMSFFLMTSSFETVLLIPANAFQTGGAADGGRWPTWPIPIWAALLARLMTSARS